MTAHNPNAVDPSEIGEETGVDTAEVRRVVIKAQHDPRLGQGKPLAY